MSINSPKQLKDWLSDYFTFKIPAIHEFDTSDIAVGYC